jgi:hypothetical protein
MSKPRYSILAAGVLAVLMGNPLWAFIPNDEQRLVLTGGTGQGSLSFLAPAPPPSEWAFVQEGAGNARPSDRGRRGPGGPGRGSQRGPRIRDRFNAPMGDQRPPFPSRILNQLRNLKPDERERVLQNNPRFRELPPERKAQLLDRLNMLLEMDEDQRRDLDRRLSVFRNLTPEQRRRAREIYENHWRTLGPERRVAIMEEFRNLRDMSPEERDRRIDSSEYQNQFSLEERALLDELSSL